MQFIFASGALATAGSIIPACIAVKKEGNFLRNRLEFQDGEEVIFVGWDGFSL
jgi:hypothetical protein